MRTWAPARPPRSSSASSARPRRARSPAASDLERRLRELLAEVAQVGDDRIDVSHQPSVLLTVGVNGTGKTTTIGKMAWHLQKEAGLSVIMAAADTYRAAAQEQLTEWAQRAGCEIVRANPGSDPGAVVFDAIEAARARGHDVVIADTAGPPAHPGPADGGAGEGAARDREADARGAARDAADRGRDHRPERPAPGQALPRDRRRDRASC